MNHQYTPEILGIDEAHIDDHYRLILTDIKEQKLLDMKPDNKTRTVKAYLNLNYWDYKWTNAYMESVNNAIKISNYISFALNKSSSVD